MKIKKIEIENFLSISDVSYEFGEGIYELKGVNEDVIVDGIPSSNGTGKSAFTLAILQCLYNKNPKVSLTDSCSNNVTNLPYVITLTVESNGEIYTITNNRSKLQLIVATSTSILSTRIKDSLPIIEKIIGMTYSEFISLMYVNSTTISNSFSPDSNLILKYFDLTILDTYMKNLKEERRELTTSLKGLQLRVSDINKRSLAIDETAINTKIARLEEDKVKLLDSHEYIVNGGMYTEDINDINSKINSNSSILKTLEAQLKLSALGVCPTCSQGIKNTDTSTIETQINKVDYTINKLNVEYDSLHERFNKAKRDFDSKLRELDIEIAQNQSKLVTRKHLEQVSNDDVTDIQKELLATERKLTIVKSVITTLDTGKVTTAHLHTFLIGMNMELTIILNNIGVDIEVTASIRKSSIYFTITQDGIIKTIDMLSGGEETLLSLVILTALYITLEKQMGIIVPILFLDETFNRIDNRNISKISRLMDILKQGRTVVVIQHHNELPTSTFKDTISLRKLNGVTTRSK